MSLKLWKLIGENAYADVKLVYVLAETAEDAVANARKNPRWYHPHGYSVEYIGQVEPERT